MRTARTSPAAFDDRRPMWARALLELLASLAALVAVAVLAWIATTPAPPEPTPPCRPGYLVLVPATPSTTPWHPPARSPLRETS
ncbi:hypothetical protein [Nocardia blacklockiae]|uniref:hypothetical protein n=1 Tax=Nocardia blacklockiae TaxID=480036 RepID=UPI001895AC1E|nr:hypothetical protein [Nocardia blacklockiae]MBF6171146.1 hypothetical protein [Nocardia blacklockiae]